MKSDRVLCDEIVDEAWYLASYPDVAAAVSSGTVKSASQHYLLSGVREGRQPRPLRPGRNDAKIVHLHIPKTAGTCVREAFVRNKNKVFYANPDFEFNDGAHANYEVFSGHFGYAAANSVPDAELITVLRDPIERFLSAYYYLVQLYDSGEEITDRTELAKRYTIEEYVRLFDCPVVVMEQFNPATWQIAHGNRPEERSAFRKEITSENELLMSARKNLLRCSVVGFQNNLRDLSTEIKSKYNVELSFEQENTTKNKPKTEDIDLATINKIYDSVYLDMELYRWADITFNGGRVSRFYLLHEENQRKHRPPALI
jgi:hypothetical protein